MVLPLLMGLAGSGLAGAGMLGGLGALAGGALGSAAGTIAQGGDLEDAIMSGVTSYFGGKLLGGMGGKMAGGQGILGAGATAGMPPSEIAKAIAEQGASAAAIPQATGNLFGDIGLRQGIGMAAPASGGLGLTAAQAAAQTPLLNPMSGMMQNMNPAMAKGLGAISRPDVLAGAALNPYNFKTYGSRGGDEDDKKNKMNKTPPSTMYNRRPEGHRGGIDDEWNYRFSQNYAGGGPVQTGNLANSGIFGGRAKSLPSPAVPQQAMDNVSARAPIAFEARTPMSVGSGLPAVAAQQAQDNAFGGNPMANRQSLPSMAELTALPAPNFGRAEEHMAPASGIAGLSPRESGERTRDRHREIMSRTPEPSGMTAPVRRPDSIGTTITSDTIGDQGSPSFWDRTMNFLGFAEGGMVPGEGEDQTIIMAAVKAIQGLSDTPKIDLGRFVAEFGEDALRDLVERVQAGEFGEAGTQQMDGTYVQGGGDGMSDSVAAVVDGEQPAALSSGEFVVPADVVSGLGNGSSDAGAASLEDMMGRIRMAKGGTVQQPPSVDMGAVLPA